MSDPWRNYDAWKTRSPDDEEEERERQRLRREREEDRADVEYERWKDERE